MLVELFWLAAAGAIYAYLGYPLVLATWLRLRGARTESSATPARYVPGVSMIVPVHNESGVIAAKLANTEALTYEAGRLEVLFVSDASTDGADEAIASRAGERIRLIRLPQRGGKAAALNAGLAEASHEIIVFSDASIMLDANAVEEIVQPFQDPHIGCVSGEDWIADRGGESLYGRYELNLRRLESQLGSIVGASGLFYAQRRELCDQFVPHVAPDFLSVLLTVDRGSRAVTCPTARGRMTALATPAQEFERKVRTILRGITTLAWNARLLNPLRFGSFAFILFSHKLMRWMVPFFLLVTLGTSGLLAFSSSFYLILFGLQACFYGLAVAGVYGPLALRRWLVSRVAVYFGTVTFATLVAWGKFVAGLRQEVWAPTRRGAR